jgi:protoporphyrinogen/coproporphyrinogen III oxidase
VTEQRVVVIGAGLTGLSVGARLAKQGQDVLLLEGASRVGGQIDTFRYGGLIVELGAEGFVARSRAVPALCALIGREAALVDQLSTDTYALENGVLTLLPPGEAARRLGFQVPVEELGRGIRSLSQGMGELTEALHTFLGARVRLEAPVASVERRGSRLVVQLAEGGTEPADAVVVATPARVAATMLQPLGVKACAALSDAPLLSNVSVNLLYRSADFAHYPAGSGLIFPDSFGSVGLRALSLVDHKFPGRVSADQALLRVFFRPVGDALQTWSDEQFAAEAAQAISQVLTVSGEPTHAWVSRWQDALPVHSPQYKAQVAAADDALQALGVHLAGSAFHGAGIDAAVASAEVVAARLATFAPSMPPS